MVDHARVEYDAETMPRLAREWRMAGATPAQIAERFGVDVAILACWRAQHRALDEALQDDAVADADVRVEQALLKSAQGFQYEEVTTELDEEAKVVHTKVVKKLIPPNISAQKFWLINRRKGRWKAAPPPEDEHFGEQLKAFTNALMEHAKAVVEDETGEQISPKQARGILGAKQRWNLFIGATRSGKSFTQQLLIPRRVQEAIPGLYVLLAKTQGNVESNILSPMRELYGEEFIGRPTMRYGLSRVKIFGKEFIVLGGDNLRAVDKLRGKTVGYCAGDEGPTWPDALLQMLKTRLTDPRAKVDITGNPEGPRHPFKTDLIDRAAELNVFHLAFGLDDNPILSAEIKAQLRRELQGVWYQRLILGLWVAAEGAIYDAFTEARHMIDHDPEARLLRREVVACDYGTGNPTVYLRLAEGIDGVWYVLDEYCWDASKTQRQKTDAEYLVDLQSFITGRSPQSIFIDPSAASFMLACRRAGLAVAPADNAVVDGIRFVASLFAANRLRIHRRCATLLAELPGYVWDAHAAEHGEDRPVKVNDHACDALRYALWTLHAPAKGAGRAVIAGNLPGRFGRR